MRKRRRKKRRKKRRRRRKKRRSNYICSSLLIKISSPFCKLENCNPISLCIEVYVPT
jgi:hypothetical protein